MSRDFDAGPRARANFFDVGVVGRRTGITMKANIKKDADGLDNIDDFWDDDEGEDGQNGGAHIQDREEEHYVEDYGDQNQSPPPRQQQQQQQREQQQHRQKYFEQELPEELLSTPTSRRSRNVPMSKGSANSIMMGSARGLSLPGGSMYDNAPDEYQSPSFHAVKKRLVFTKDSSDIEPDQEEDYLPVRARPQQQSQPSYKGVSSSPALDKLLHASREKKAQFRANAAIGSPLTARPTLALPTLELAPKASKKQQQQVRPAATKSAAAARSAATGTTAASRRANLPKAFDLGTESDESQADTGGLGEFESNHGDYSEYDGQIESTPGISKAQTKPAGSRTPAEFKRRPAKAKVVPVAVPRDEDDNDNDIYHEQEERDAYDDRLRFSDEDEPVRGYGDGDDEEEDEPLVNHRRLKDPAQQKRTASAKEPKTISRSKIIASKATVIPKKNKAPISTSTATLKKIGAKTAASKKKAAEREERTETDEDDDDDEGRVPSATSKSGRPKKSATTAKKNSGSSNRVIVSRSHEAPVELIEVPVVPDVGTDDSGVRRSHRTKITPLSFWKNERVVLEKGDDLKPVIKAVLRAPPEESFRSATSNKRKRPTTTSSGKSNSSSTTGHKRMAPKKRGQKPMQRDAGNEDEEESSSEDDQDGLGLRDEVPSTSGEVLLFGTDKVVSRVIAENNASMQYRAVESGQYEYHRGLEDPDLLATGTIKIKPGGGKSPTTAGNGSMAFYVVKGLVQVTIHESEFVVSTGGRFLVPRGNQYGILNKSKKESVLFFVQSKTTATASAEDTHNASAKSSSSSVKAGIAHLPATETGEGSEEQVAEPSSSASVAADTRRRSASTPKKNATTPRGRRSLSKAADAGEEEQEIEGPTAEEPATPSRAGSQRRTMASFFN